MNASQRIRDDEIAAAILEGNRVRRVPELVRARLLARARATIAADIAAAAPAPFSRATWLMRWGRLAAAAAGVLVFAAAAAAATLGARAVYIRNHGAAIRPAPRAVAPAPVASAPLDAPEAPPVPDVAPRARRRPLRPQESYAAELALLQRAQFAYAGHDFAGALVLVGAHARQFPHGHLTEEREALRVRALAGAGRRDEACRDLAGLARRFPHSVVLPSLREGCARP